MIIKGRMDNGRGAWSVFWGRRSLPWLIWLSLLPIFLSLDLSSGLRLDAGAINYLGVPSLPIGFLFILLLLARDVLLFRLSYGMYGLMIVLAVQMLVSLYLYPELTPKLLFVGAVIFVHVYSLIYFRKLGEGRLFGVGQFFRVGFAIVFVKLVFDIVLRGGVSSDRFIIDSIVIYNYYDYFPFLYFVLICGALSGMMFIGYMRNAFALIVMYIIILSTESRVFIALSLAAPMILLVFKLVKFRTMILFLGISLCVVVSIFLSIAELEWLPLDDGLSVRLGHWHQFVDHFDTISFLLPSLNHYRIENPRISFHNEYFELFSLFGWVSLIYLLYAAYSLYRKAFRDPLFCTILLGLIIGGLIQLNYSNPYVAVVFGSFSGLVLAQENRRKSFIGGGMMAGMRVGKNMLRR